MTDLSQKIDSLQAELNDLRDQQREIENQRLQEYMKHILNLLRGVTFELRPCQINDEIWMDHNVSSDAVDELLRVDDLPHMTYLEDVIVFVTRLVSCSISIKGSLSAVTRLCQEYQFKVDLDLYVADRDKLQNRLYQYDEVLAQLAEFAER